MATPSVSFEVFPPKNMTASFGLWEAARDLSELGPRFFSVTYGAGGSQPDLTHDAATLIQKKWGVPVAAHLTCTGASIAKIMERVQKLTALGIRDFVALRGDPPQGQTRFQPHPEGFASSIELIEALALTGQANIRVGAYPECHPDATSQHANIQFLKRKFDAGATEAITQFFFEPEAFLRFRDQCAAAGITAPITPGILPIANWASTKSLAERCGTSVPLWMDNAFETAIRDGRQELLATTIATEMCDTLVSEGVENLHFYTLNKSAMTMKISRALGVTPSHVLANVA